MSIFELINIIKSNLLRMKFRVILTSAGVFIGTVAIILLISLGQGLQDLATSSFGDIGELTTINVFNFQFGGGETDAPPLTDRKLDEWRKLPGVTAVTPEISLQSGSSLRLNRYTAFGSSITGIDPDAVDGLDFKLQEGTARLGRGQIIVGGALGERFRNENTQQKPNSPIDMLGQNLQLVITKFNDDGTTSEKLTRLRVGGVLEESGGQDDSVIYMDMNQIMELNQWATGSRVNLLRDGYSQVLVKAVDTESVTPIEAVITAEGYNAFSLQSILGQINIVFVGLQVAFGCIGSIALIVAAIGIANTMIMAIYERTREIGLMKAVGATNREVMVIFLGEAGSIGLIGGITGVIVGVGLGRLAGFAASSYFASQGNEDLPSLVQTPMWLLIFALVFSLVIGILSGIYPALRAVRLDPITALKYE